MFASLATSRPSVRGERKIFIQKRAGLTRMSAPERANRFLRDYRPTALPNESQGAGQVGFHLHELRTVEDRLGFRADRSAPLMENPEQAGRC